MSSTHLATVTFLSMSSGAGLKMRQDRQVPNNFSPADPDRSETVAFALEILGNSAKSLILKYLSANPGARFGQIHDAIPDLNLNTLARHLRTMEQAGVIELDVPPGERRGRAPRYTVVPGAIEAMTNEWLRYLGLDPK